MAIRGKLNSIMSTVVGIPPGWWVCVVVVFIAVFIFYQSYLHPLSKAPGPTLARFTELWRTNRYFQGKWHIDILQLHRKYGPVVRIAPNEVSIVSPDLVKTVYGHSKGTRKTNWYDTWKALGGGKSDAISFFGATDPAQHGFLRKRVSAAYSMSTVVSLEGKIQPVMNTLWQRFDEFAKRGEPINLSLWASYLTYDVVGTLCLSDPMGFIESGYDKDGFIGCIHGAFYWISNLGYLPLQSSWLTTSFTDLASRVLGLPLSRYSRAFGTFSVGKIIQRIQEGPKRTGDRDMLDHFVEMKDPQGAPAGIGDVLAEVGNLLAAGADTTSVAIKAVLGPLLQDPVRYKRLQMEIDAVPRTSNDSEDTHDPLSFNKIKDLPFLSACIKEGGRLHPSITYQLPRLAPADGLNIEGYYIPASATLSMSPLAQNRCRDIFGEDADVWNPERWIKDEGNSLEKIKEMEKQLATFGYGSRTCIGRNLATFEVYKFMAQLVSRYDVELLNPSNPWSIRSCWFSEIDNLHIRLKRRV